MGVTGGAGFIGSHLVDALIEHGADVVVVDDLTSGRRENLAPREGRLALEIGSITDDVALERAFEDVELVYHQAALTSVPKSVAHPRRFLAVNAVGTMQVLNAARLAGARRVIIASSSSVYGDQNGEAKVETMKPAPRSPYAAAKLSAEDMARAFAHCYDLQVLCLRYFNIFGPRQRPDSPYAAVIPRFIDAMRHGRRPAIFGDGSQTRDFTYVDNVVHANLLAGLCTGEFGGDAVNIACGQSTSLLELVHALAELIGAQESYELSEPRVGEVLHSRADISRARELLGYEPTIGFDEGLRRTVEGNKSTSPQVNTSTSSHSGGGVD